MNNLTDQQWQELQVGLDHVFAQHPFYRDKFRASGLVRDDIKTPADFFRLPLTTKQELVDEQRSYPPHGRLFISRGMAPFVRAHHTSGTTGRKLKWLDTKASWQWVLDAWKDVFRAAEILPTDRLFFPFSFGPFLGFWAAFESAGQLDYFCFAAGGLSTQARLKVLIEERMTVVLCTPTYACHLVDSARQAGIDLASSAVRLVILAGEPGANRPKIRQKIEEGFAARVLDHAGMTETGPTSFELIDEPGKLFLNERFFITEFLDPKTHQPVAEGEPAELVLTNLGRWDCPLIRYRTGDIVVHSRASSASKRLFGESFVYCDAGILGRADDMLLIKGNNVYPAAIEEVMLAEPAIHNFRILVDYDHEPCVIEAELHTDQASPEKILARLSESFACTLFFRPTIKLVPLNTLPTSEMKSQRLVRKPSSR